MIFAQIRNKFESEFAKNVLTLFTGSAIAQIIPVLVSPLLSRLYSPDDFGTMALFVSIASIISIIITGQYENAIVITKEESDAINIAALACIITVLVSIVTLFILLLFRKSICILLKSEDLNKYLLFVPISVFLTGVFQILNYWTSRKKQFKRLALRQVAQSVTSSSVKLGSGVLNPTPMGLIAGNIIGQLSATSVLSYLAYKEDNNYLRFIKKIRIRELALRYKNFPIYNVPQGFLDSFSANSTIFIISSFFSTSILGFYSFAASMLTFPMRLLGNSITQVFFQKASYVNSKEINLWPDIKKMVSRLAIIGFPVFLVIFLFAPEVFSIVFGSNWKEAGVYAQILTPYLFANFIGSPISSIPMILNKQKQFFRISLFGNVGMPLLLLGSISFFANLKLALIIWSVSGIIFYAIAFLWIRYISKNYTKNHN